MNRPPPQDRGLCILHRLMRISLLLLAALAGAMFSPGGMGTSGRNNPTNIANARGMIEVHDAGPSAPSLSLHLMERRRSGWALVAELPLDRPLPPGPNDDPANPVYRYRYYVSFRLHHSTFRRIGFMYSLACALGTSRDEWRPDDFRLQVVSDSPADVFPAHVLVSELSDNAFLRSPRRGTVSSRATRQETYWDTADAPQGFSVQMR